MKPNEMSLYLKRMANAIDASKAPDRNKVINDLRRLIAGVNPEETTGKIPADVKPILNRLEGHLDNIDKKTELITLIMEVIKNSDVKKLSDINYVLTAVRKKFNFEEDDTN